MAGFFKKRRAASGPNKNEQKVMRGRSAENQTRLGARFSTIKRLVVRLTFLDAQQVLLDEKTLTLGPSDGASFKVECPGRCGRGSFDFSAKVAEAAAARLAVSECGAKCQEPLYAGSPDVCGCQIKCRLEMDYLPAGTIPA